MNGPAALEGPEAAALAAIVAGPLAWSSQLELDRLGHCACVLEDLERAGLVQRWTLNSGVHWTLRPIAAARLGVHLIAPHGVLVWSSGPGDGPRVRGGRRPIGWNPWALRIPRPAPLFLEVDELEITIFGRRVNIDKRLARRPAPVPRRARGRAVAGMHP